MQKIKLGYIDSNTAIANQAIVYTGSGIAWANVAGDSSAVFLHANSAYDKANSANLLAFNTGVGANAWANSLSTVDRAIANTAANSANSFAAATYGTIANTAAAFLHANSAYAKANTASGGAGAAYYSGNNGDVGVASGLGDIFRVHTNTLNANVTIYSGNNALAAGPITVASGKTLTIQSNARVSIV